MGSKLKKWRTGIDSVDIYPSPPRLIQTLSLHSLFLDDMIHPLSLFLYDINPSRALFALSLCDSLCTNSPSVLSLYMYIHASLSLSHHVALYDQSGSLWQHP